MSRNAPQLPNTTSTANAVQVYTSTGFSQGDLIYSKNGDCGTIPNNALSTAPFTIQNSSSVISGSSGGPVSLLSSVNGNLSARQAAKLTNGNIVVVAFKSTSPNQYCPVFTVYDTSGTVVVSETVISATYTSGGQSAQIGVVALTGGGFAAFWLNGAGGTIWYPCIAIYTNTGSVTTSAFQDTPPGVGNSQCSMTGTALPNGGFAIAYVNSATSQPITRAYGATGTAAYGWTAGGSVTYQTFINIGLAARSDSSTCMVWQTTTTTFQYVVLTSAGGVVASSTFTPTVANNANQRSVDVTVLADGTTFVIGYNTNSGSYVYSCFRFLPTGNVLSSEYYVPPLNLNTGFSGVSTMARQVRVHGLANGGFVFFFTDSTQSWNYAFFNASGVPVSGVSGSIGTGAATRCLPFTYTFDFQSLAIVEITGYINLYWSQGVASQSPLFQQLAQINTTTYSLVNSNAYTETVGTANASVNAYSKSGSTPSGATFTATNTETLVTNKTYAITGSPQTIRSSACDGISAATFSNGNFVVAYRDQSTLQVYFSVFSAAGALLQTVSVGTGYPSATYFTVKVAVLTSGNIVVGYHTGSNLLTLTVYTGSVGAYSASYTTTLSAVVMPTATVQYGIAGITNNRFVVAYTGPSNYPYYTVYDSALNIVAGPTSPISYPSTSNMNVAPLPGGGFVMTWWYNGSNKQLYIFKNDSGNTFSGLNGWGYSSNVDLGGAQVVVTPSNLLYVPVNSSGSAVGTYTWDYYQNAASSSNQTVTNAAGAYQVGMTGSGAVVTIQLDSGGQYLWGTPVGTWSGTGAPQNSSRLALTGFSPYTSTGAGQVCTTPGVGNSVVIAYLDSSRYPTFGIVTAMPASFTASLTAGVTPSAPTAVNPGTIGVLNGYVFQGVSLTSASAGSTGLVQTNGLATLNSSYSASTAGAGFDHTKPNGSGIDGVKGTIVGRSVNLQGYQ